ncbi:DUF2158 domain-containing protein [Brevundimonas sp. GCM10030266]|uniref:DUF2158 domain-containing protein n=1 Tax=Brevundimonas sp. GCM10030266 TaxID=3273386 RepID=UPI00361FADAB
MADQIEAGDIVKLKSDGPWMTVTKVGAISGIQNAWVAWFTGDEPKSDHFPLSALTKKP